ncbi:MAG TPA: hypothetical protein VMZ28_26780 [Kofleriaceae bacterium]|nr:hypothetical protein [Kofleriaceae bacterium]
MHRLWDPILRFWRDRVLGPKLRTYDAAREELGGVPWRAHTNTERWFLTASPTPPTGATTMDTGALILSKPGFGELLRGKGMILAGVGAGFVVLICAFALSGGKSAPAAAIAAAAAPAPTPAVAAPVAAAVPAPAPAVAPAKVTVPAVAPVKAVSAHSAKNVSPSVRALFGNASGGKARPAAKARPKHAKSRRR